MDVILSTVWGLYALVYLDDNFIFSKKPEEHFKHTEMVSRLLKNGVVSLNLQKCALFTNGIFYVGRMILPGHCEVAKYTADASRKLKASTILTEAGSF